MSLNVLDLFSGIGGFSLGLERAGMRTVAFCEIEPYCRAVLRKHWPGVPIFDDVRKLTAADVGAIDVICGGFPCQDISIAGKGAGIEGKRSGLWSEYLRLISELRPSFVIVENVAALLDRGMGRILGDLAEIGYDAEWDCIPASAVGAPHERDRVWVVSYPASIGQPEGCKSVRVMPKDAGSDADTWNGRRMVEPGIQRVVDGVPGQLDRLRACGNAVVPQIPEIIGRAIVEGLRR